MARGGIWLPDVLLGNKRCLATAELSSGHRFRVVQYWNNFDFYWTQLEIITPDGHTEVKTLDGDDRARWKILMQVNEERRVVHIEMGGRGKSIRW